MIPGPRDVAAFPEGCAWSGWAPPDIRHCEENLCAWIAAPADTWSNLAYLLAAAWLWREAKHSRGALRLFPAVLVAVGVTSFAFHASNTAFFQFFDYIGMFLLAGLLFALALERLGRSTAERAVSFVLSFTAASAAAFWGVRAAGLPVQLLIILQVLALVALEIKLALRSSGTPRLPIAALLLLSAGAVFWILDYTRLLCDPNDHVFQAHAVWHLLTAGALASAFRFYAARRMKTASAMIA